MMCLKCGAIAVTGSDVCRAHGGREDDNTGEDATCICDCHSGKPLYNCANCFMGECPES